MGDRNELIQSVYFDVVVLLTRFERYDESIDMLQRMLANGAPDPALTEPAGLAGLRLPLLPSEVPPDRLELVHLAGRAVLDVQTQHYEDAESELKQLVTNYPNEPGVHYLYGAYLVQLHPNESVAEFERELEISPSHVLARVRLAEQLIAERDFDRALALAQQAIKLDPKRASPHMLAGEALRGQGRRWRGHQGTGNRARHRSHSRQGRTGICFAPISLRGEKKMRIGRSRRLKNWVTATRRALREMRETNRTTSLRHKGRHRGCVLKPKVRKSN